MKISVYTPNDRLKPSIACYRIIQSEKGMINRVLPATSLALAIRLQGHLLSVSDSVTKELTAATFSGLRSSVRLFDYAPATASLVVEFTETGASCFFGISLHKLFERSISLADLIPARVVSILEERLAEADNDSVRIGIIDEFLCSRLIHEKPDALVCQAISRIRASNGMTRIKPLADALYISQDAFEKRFRKVTGTSPKQFSFIVKMRSLLAEDGKQASMLPLALKNGFYDQPHFIKAFKVFTGLTPTEFLISGEHW